MSERSQQLGSDLLAFYRGEAELTESALHGVVDTLVRGRRLHLTPMVEMGDLYSAAGIAIMRCARNYRDTAKRNPAQHALSYTMVAVRRACLTELTKAPKALSLDEELYVETEEEVAIAMDFSQGVAKIGRVIGDEMLFVFQGVADGCSYSEMARVVGCTVRQMQHRVWKARNGINETNLGALYA
jgi:hypothetical protein